MNGTTEGAIADPLHAGVAVLVHSPQRAAQEIADAFIDGEVGPIETIRRLTTLLRSVDAVLKPLQEAREAIREVMERPSSPKATSAQRSISSLPISWRKAGRWPILLPSSPRSRR